MSTTKTATKTEREGAQKKAPRKDDLLVASEIHTLAHILYGELATTCPWVVADCGPPAFRSTSTWMPPMGESTLSMPFRWPA